MEPKTKHYKIEKQEQISQEDSTVDWEVENERRQEEDEKRIGDEFQKEAIKKTDMGLTWD